MSNDALGSFLIRLETVAVRGQQTLIAFWCCWSPLSSVPGSSKARRDLSDQILSIQALFFRMSLSQSR